MGPLISGTEFDYLRNEAQEAMPDQAVVLGGTIVDDLGGGGSMNWKAAGTYPCRLAPIAGQEVNEGSRITAEVEAIVTLPAATPIDVENQIRIDGHTYNVVQVKPRAGTEVTRRVEVKEVD